MMKQGMTYCLVLFSLLIFPFAGTSALAAQPDNFTATMVTQGMAMPMAKMGMKTRVENMAMKGMVNISLRDAKKTITLSTTSKTFFEQPMQDSMRAPSAHDPDVVIDKKKTGTETIDGHPCIKYDSTFYRKSEPEKKYNAVIWEAQDLNGFPVKTEVTVPKNAQYPGSGGKIVTQFKDIKMGGATASMFEVPKGYKKVNSIQEVMGSGDPTEMMKQMQKMKRPPKE